MTVPPDAGNALFHIGLSNAVRCRAAPRPDRLRLPARAKRSPAARRAAVSSLHDLSARCLSPIRWYAFHGRVDGPGCNRGDVREPHGTRPGHCIRTGDRTGTLAPVGGQAAEPVARFCTRSDRLRVAVGVPRAAFHQAGDRGPIRARSQFDPPDNGNLRVVSVQADERRWGEHRQDPASAGFTLGFVHDQRQPINRLMLMSIFCGAILAWRLRSILDRGC
jgi:hypothetical protein